MTDQVQSLEAQLLVEARRTRMAVETIRTFVGLWFALSILAAIIFGALAIQ